MTLVYRSTIGRRLTVSEGDGNISQLSDSANITFLPSGTGGVQRTVSSKLKDIVSTADYDTAGHYQTARNALAPTIGVAALDVVGVLSAGSLTFSGNVPMSGFIFTGLGAGSAAGHSVRWEQSAPGVVTANGDLVVGSASGAVTNLAVGSAGSIPMSRTAATNKIAYVAALKSAIYGFTYANNAGDATNDLDIAAGGAMDATGAYWMTGAALTKQSDAAWAVGTGAGALDTGAVGNSDYYIWAIARSDTGVVDYLFSLSSTAPTMPANYDFKRLIGWFKRVGGTIVAFLTYETEGGGLRLKWSAPTVDVSLTSTLTTSRRTDTVKVPLNFSVLAHIRACIQESTGTAFAVVCSPDETDAAPSTTVAPLINLSIQTSTFGAPADLNIQTSATGTIAARANIATVDEYRILTLGFTWARRN